MPGLESVDKAHSLAALMSYEQSKTHLETIQQQLAALQAKNAEEPLEESNTAIEGLYLIYEEMQTSLEAAQLTEEGLLDQNQQIATAFQHYYDLFQSSPIPYLVTDADGVIVEANRAIAQLLNVPQRYLVGKPLILYVAEHDRPSFYSNLNRLSSGSGIQVWQLSLNPRASAIPAAELPVELHIDIVRNESGWIETLRIGVYVPAAPQQDTASPHSLDPAAAAPPQLPQSLDGLRVLVVDDEADVREFITAILEPHGVGVLSVDCAGAALAALSDFRPDVLVSDIRMPGGDGYQLIQQVRAMEAEWGGHIPAAAITAYLDEDRDKALTAGYEAHLHKLAQPTELVELVAQLAGRQAKR